MIDYTTGNCSRIIEKLSFRSFDFETIEVFIKCHLYEVGVTFIPRNIDGKIVFMQLLLNILAVLVLLFLISRKQHENDFDAMEKIYDRKFKDCNNQED